MWSQNYAVWISESPSEPFKARQPQLGPQLDFEVLDSDLPAPRATPIPIIRSLNGELLCSSCRIHHAHSPQRTHQLNSALRGSNPRNVQAVAGAMWWALCISSAHYSPTLFCRGYDPQFVTASSTGEFLVPVALQPLWILGVPSSKKTIGVEYMWALNLHPWLHPSPGEGLELNIFFPCSSNPLA